MVHRYLTNSLAMWPAGEGAGHVIESDVSGYR